MVQGPLLLGVVCCGVTVDETSIKVLLQVLLVTVFKKKIPSNDEDGSMWNFVVKDSLVVGCMHLDFDSQTGF